MDHGGGTKKANFNFFKRAKHFVQKEIFIFLVQNALT